MRAVSLEYHDVTETGVPDASGFPGASAASYKLTVAEFEDHLAALDAVPASLRQLPNRTAPASGAPPIYLTFDDGGISAATHIAPRLEQRGWRGIFLVATGAIGTAGFMSEEQIRDLDARGHLIGAHSHSHPLRMGECSEGALRTEWRTSVAMLREILGGPVQIASIPGGQYRRRVAEAAEEAGIRSLFTSEPETAIARMRECQVYGRFTLRAGMPGEVAAALAVGRGSARARQWIIWNGKKTLKRLGGDRYLSLRERIFARRRDQSSVGPSTSQQP
jgi:peptidoglycan/xylan/chitin deacetylase (PgdA/CDA1 family)